ncbi:uncharacterized protein DS421_11g330610 [Arachis hypogaea]|nr:uncharacterized protein DS421_11g330610 [Arachis hypogaea]
MTCVCVGCSTSLFKIVISFSSLLSSVFTCSSLLFSFFLHHHYCSLPSLIFIFLSPKSLFNAAYLKSPPLYTHLCHPLSQHSCPPLSRSYISFSMPPNSFPSRAQGEWLLQQASTNLMCMISPATCGFEQVKTLASGVAFSVKAKVPVSTTLLVVLPLP